MKFSHTKMLSLSASALLAVTLSAAVVPAANATAPALTPTMVSAVTSTPDSYNAQVLALINIERAKVGSGPVKWNQAISNVSQDWAAHLGIATLDPNFDFATIHRTDAGGNEIPAGYTWYRENIAFASTPETIVNWWMGSPGHKAAMLDPKATDIGIGYVVPSSGPYAGWHQVVTNLAAYPATTTPSPTPTTGVPAGTQYKTTIQLNLRSGPGTTYDILGSGVTGTIVTATGNTNGIWYEVKMGSQSGWMSSDYLAKYADAVAPTPAPAPATQSAIAIKAASLGGGLGSAVGAEVYGLKGGGAYQNYQRGAILWSPASGAHVSTGAIRNLWAATGFENGGLGYPVSDEVGGLRDGGVYQNYQGGAIIWSPATGAHISTGAIRNLWAATGFENGGLGYPVSDEIGGLRDGGVFQNYQGGAIIWSPATGARISTGAIRGEWAATGFEGGRMGYPLSNEVGGLKDGGVYQMYQGGAILWSPASGAHISVGGIRSTWASTGFESGRLGYPTSDEYSTGNGGAAQDYQGGKISWTPASGSTISYK